MIHILVSACLLGDNCTWNGGNNRNEAVLELMHRLEGKAEFHAVCPEQMGGLSTPRPASEIRQSDGIVENTEGQNVTAEFLLGADLALREAKKYGCMLALLKDRSPSCGSRGVYDGTFSHHLVEGQGKTAALLADYGIRVLGESELEFLAQELISDRPADAG